MLQTGNGGTAYYVNANEIVSEITKFGNISCHEKFNPITFKQSLNLLFAYTNIMKISEYFAGTVQILNNNKIQILRKNEITIRMG